MTVDLTAWLRAALDEDEDHSKKDLWAIDRATPGRWEAHYGYNLPYSILCDEGGVEIARFVAETVPSPDGADGQHAADLLLVGRLVRKARTRAERVLRQVAAHRRIVAEYEQAQRRLARPTETDSLRSADAELAVRIIASIYADRPGYDPAWAPEGT